MQDKSTVTVYRHSLCGWQYLLIPHNEFHVIRVKFHHLATPWISPAQPGALFVILRITDAAFVPSGAAAVRYEIGNAASSIYGSVYNTIFR